MLKCRLGWRYELQGLQKPEMSDIAANRLVVCGFGLIVLKVGVEHQVWLKVKL